MKTEHEKPENSQPNENKPSRLAAVTGIPKFIPILFSTPMVQAILEGRKTQTRRILKVKGCRPFTPDKTWSIDDIRHWNSNYHPYGIAGDILWVRESFYEPMFEGLNGKYYYKADLEKQGWDFKWKPSIHMPKAACRIFLKVKSVRVERLHQISRGDAMAEGCPFPNMAKGLSPVDWFADLWNSINGPNSFESSPFVWVVEFERTERPAGFC